MMTGMEGFVLHFLTVEIVLPRNNSLEAEMWYMHVYVHDMHFNLN